MKRLTLYLPDKDQNGKPVDDIDMWVNEAFFLLATHYGGATRPPPAKGLWYNEKLGVFIQETTHQVYSYGEVTLSSVHDFIKRFLTHANQQSVAVEIGDQMHFIGAKPTSLNGDARVHMEAHNA
jgi:hypothetical protein